ncbi:MAG TPA: S9 family peptidase, partial [Clostridia bacterium]|nr:S9 family peptidase [Clostridia bacterium]
TDVLDFNLAPGKEEIAYIATTYEDVREAFKELHLFTLADKKDRIVRKEIKFHYSYFDYLTDKTLIFLGSDGLTHGNNQNHEIYKMDRKSLETRKLSPENWDISIGSSIAGDTSLIGGRAYKTDGGKFYFSSTEFDHSYLNVIDEEGKIQKLTKLPGSVDTFDVKNGKIYAVLKRDLKLQELYEIKDTEERQITDFNIKGNKLDRAKTESFEFKLNEREYTGYVLLPSDYDPKKKYPGILSIHGGPKAAYGTIFFHELHYFAQEGYIVFFTNPRGSDGRGGDFSDIRGKFGTIDYDDLMDFTDEVLKRYSSIDVDKLGVMGGSYGGFMTNWMIGHTHRFAAACSQRSISNWISKFGITDIGYIFNADQHKATPWDRFDSFWEGSPLKHAPNAKTPTLFIHADEDHRCHYSCSMQMHTALKIHGVKSRFVLFHGENHELSRSGKPKERIRRLQEIDNWFAHYLKGEKFEALG